MSKSSSWGVMTDMLPVESDAMALEADPVGYMTTILSQARSWLEEAEGIDDVRHAKAIAQRFENATRQKEMALGAQLAATEIVRRCERRLEELMRHRLPNSTNSTVAHYATAEDSGRDKRRRSPKAFVGTMRRAGGRALADADGRQFDDAIREAREEGDLSRANIIRKLRGESKPEGPVQWHHTTQHSGPSGAHDRRAANSAEGTLADPDSAARAAEHRESVVEIVTALTHIYDNWGAVIWLQVGQFGERQHETALDLVSRGRAAEVMARIERLQSGTVA
jgi:hypothetical protein